MASLARSNDQSAYTLQGRDPRTRMRAGEAGNNDWLGGRAARAALAVRRVPEVGDMPVGGRPSGGNFNDHSRAAHRRGDRRHGAGPQTLSRNAGFHPRRVGYHVHERGRRLGDLHSYTSPPFGKRADSMTGATGNPSSLPGRMPIQREGPGSGSSPCATASRGNYANSTLGRGRALMGGTAALAAPPPSALPGPLTQPPIAAALPGGTVVGSSNRPAATVAVLNEPAPPPPGPAAGDRCRWCVSGWVTGPDRGGLSVCAPFRPITAARSAPTAQSREVYLPRCQLSDRDAAGRNLNPGWATQMAAGRVL